MALITFLFIASFITSSISAKSVDIADIENTKSVFDIEYPESVETIEDSEEIINREFCIYTDNSMMKMIDPYYIDSSNNKVYFDNIEDYARYIGPNWFGVSFCGNNTVVNNIGEYFKVVENPNYKKRDTVDDDDKKNEDKKDDENIYDEIDLSIYKSRSLNDYRKEYKKAYDNFIKRGLKSVALVSENPAYNPYHHALIKIEGINPDKINIITTMGIPYTGDKKLFEELAKNKTTDFIECVSLSSKDSTMTCTISYSDEIQDTVSITDDNGVSYHKSAGKVYTQGDTYTEEKNRSLELARALSVSNSTNESTSNGFSKSIEKVHNIINTTSNSTSENTEDTHTDSKDFAHTYSVSEDHSHAETTTHDESNETNWSKSEETSKTEEYSRMNTKDWDQYKNEKFFPAPPPADKSTMFEKAYDAISNLPIIKKLKFTGEHANKTREEQEFETRYTVSNPYSYRRKRHFSNLLNTTYKHIKRDVTGVVEGLVGLGNIIVGAMGVYLQDEANIIQREAIYSQEKIAAEQGNLQIAMAKAGTRTSGETKTHGKTNGGAKTVNDGWSKCNTDSSGINDGWTNSTGYSDAHTTGHSETSTKENSVSDSTSKMVSSNFNKDTGWVNEESRTNTTTNGYTYGHSTQTSNTTQDSYDEAIDISAHNSYTFSNTFSKSKSKSATIQVTLKEDGPQKITPLPLFNTEVVIWATGYQNEDGETEIRYSKSLVPISLTNFTYSLEFYGDDSRVYNDGLVNPNIRKFIFYREDEKSPNTLISGKYLKAGQYISTTNGSYSFGLLATGELVLCEGSSINSDGCSNKLWSNGITTLNDGTNHNLKFFIHDNGHLYITAKNIYKSKIKNVKYSDELINKFTNYANLVNANYTNTPFKENLKKKLNLIKYNQLKESIDIYNVNFTNLDDSIFINGTHNETRLEKRIHINTKKPINTGIIKTPIKISTTEKPANTKTTKTTTATNTTRATTTTNTTKIPTATNTIRTTTTTNTTKTSTDTSIPTDSEPPKDSIHENENNYFGDNDYIIWDSLPKDLPFNVGYPDNKGYYLYISEYKSNNLNDPRIGATVSLYDGVGVKLWEIYGTQKNYQGYAFPVEYVYPLSIDTTIHMDKNYNYKHNILKKSIKDLNTNTIEMNCKNMLKQETALVSNNKQYRFFVQDTGNMIIKDKSRTTWSSMTANIEIFKGPYHLAFSPIGEFMLRDNNELSIWHSINPIVYNNKYEILHKYKFNLTLSDEGELFVEDQYHNVYWSNWDERLFSNHMRFVNPVKYEINTCDEYVRNEYIDNLFTKPEYYEYYLVPNDPSTLIKKYYYNNLLPGESLQSDYNAELRITNNEAIFYYDKNNLNNSITLASCSNNDSVKQLRLDITGLFLDCNKGKSVSIASIELENISKYEKKINQALTYNHNSYYNDYNRLSIEYRINMDYPTLMINNVLTWETIWSLNPAVRYLSKVENTNTPIIYRNKIISDNTFSVYDKLYSSDKIDENVYISNRFGLEFVNGFILNLKSMNINKNVFYINNYPIIKNSNQMKLEYRGEFDKLIITNSTHYVWDMYGGIVDCMYFISNDEKCNTLYTYNTMNITYTSPINEEYNGIINFYRNTLQFHRYNDNNESFGIFNMTEYTKISDPIYAFTLTNEGNIILNNNEYTLHKEYFKPDDYYYLYVKNRNLILRSSTGEYKWAYNKSITNRSYDAKEIKIGDSFEENEMIYCGDYSMIILNGKLWYRNHKTKTSTEIKYSPNKSGYLYKIDIGSNSIIFLNKENKSINHIISPIESFDSKLRCDITTHTIVWEINNTVKWRYPEINPTKDEQPFIPQDKKYILLYNRNYRRCLYADSRIGKNVRYEDCNKNSNNFKWYFEIINKKSFLKSAIKDDICLIVDNKKIITGKCSENMDKALISYYEPNSYIKHKNQCISGIDEPNDENSLHNLTLITCSKKNKKMIWEQKEIPNKN
ncbi:hypothetical protein LY90DRAFT_519983 [Neocallimastix californiae]|uniref:Uncharacterized protein n=1 Tax=Neocallimastix californiae TaxID=1754190 RepID=A0A1Y1YKB6_9FUNG|nr:hypothetical protein LY90DRAFT_519983 [Neocallimastix californiae]|eukprot:ORX98451.1 hypothetical protein LY90DRAFT_519983 [Neocallimastix californiae]